MEVLPSFTIFFFLLSFTGFFLTFRGGKELQPQVRGCSNTQVQQINCREEGRERWFRYDPMRLG